MTEISLNILDIAENSIRAEALLVEINVEIDTAGDVLRVIVKDDGRGMSKEQIENVEDPFFTTRTTRKVGLGVPFFKMAALASDGSFNIESEIGKGTCVKAEFKLSHIDRMPLGDINSTVYTLVAFNQQTDFVFTYAYDEKSFKLDTREFKRILGDVPLNTPDVLKYLKEYLEENKSEVDGGLPI